MQRGLWVAIVLSVALPVACTGDDTIFVVGDGAPAADSSVVPDAGMDAKPDHSVTPEAAPEAAADAPPEAAIRADTAMPLTDPTVPLAAQSPSCLSCAQDHCSNPIQFCGGIVGVATHGPATGVSKAALCVEALSCVLTTGCAACDPDGGGCPQLSRFGRCYCDFDNPNVSVVPAFCDPVVPQYAGPCQDTILRALEATNTTDVLLAIDDVSKGGGWATQLLQCLQDNRCTSCFTPPPSDAGPAAVIDARSDATADASPDARGEASSPSSVDATPDAPGDTAAEAVLDAVSELASDVVGAEVADDAASQPAGDEADAAANAPDDAAND